MPKIKKTPPKKEAPLHANTAKLEPMKLADGKSDYVYYEKSVTRKIGEDYFKVCTGILAKAVNPLNEEELEIQEDNIQTTIERLSGIIDDEIEYQINNA